MQEAYGGRKSAWRRNIKLRQYQKDACNAVWKSWKTFDRVALCLATGTGKTLIGCKIMEHFANAEGDRSLFLVDRDELVQQTIDKLQVSTGMIASIEKAASQSHDSISMVTVGSVQSMMNEKRLQRFHPDRFKRILIDECHKSMSDSYQRVLGYFSSAKMVGLTATLMRSDKRELGSFYESVAYEYSLKKAIADGWLCKIQAQTVPISIDMSKVNSTAGDYNDADLAHVIEPYLDEIAAATYKYAKDRKTLIFLPLITTSHKMVDALRAVGLTAQHIDGKSPDRREILDAYTRGEFQCLCNSALLSYGYDEPSIDCVMILQPTRSAGAYIQKVGRGTRLSPGKENLLLLDPLWHSARHRLIHPASLVSGTEEEAERVTDKVKDAGGAPVDIEDVLNEVKNEITNERESALAKNIDANKSRKARTIDPTQFGICTLSDELVDYEAIFGWQKEEASDHQKGYLDKLGFSSDGITAGYASAIIDEVKKRREAGLATPKQVNTLTKNGYSNAGNFSFEQASGTIDWLAKNRWGKKGKKR